MNELLAAAENLAQAAQRWNMGGRRMYQGGDCYPRYLQSAMDRFEYAKDRASEEDVNEWVSATGSDRTANAYDYLA